MPDSSDDPPMRAKPLSEFCLSLSSFWADNPHLAPANIVFPKRLQLRGIESGAECRELAAYQEHMGSVRVQVIHMGTNGKDVHEVFVYLHGQIDGYPVTVWAAPITDLYEILGTDAFDTHGHCWLTPESFAQYADDGTAPEVTERPSDSAQRLAGGVMS